MNKQQIQDKIAGINEEGYVFWGDDIESKNAAFAQLNEAAGEYDSFNASAGIYPFSMTNLDPNTDGRQGFSRRHYEYFRPEEQIPKKIEDILVYSDSIYQKVGIVRNIIDLMGDFACQGIRLSHPNKRLQKFYRNWFKKVKGKEKSERFLNNLFRMANVVIRRQSGKINRKQRAKLFRSIGLEENFDDQEVDRNTIPVNYTFLHPATVKVIGGELAAFSNNRQYAIEFPLKFTTQIKSGKIDEGILKKIPEEIRRAAIEGKPFLLPKDDTLVFHYKKDDWQVWAFPIIYSVAEDIILLRKLKLADIAALDGAISNIRIFKLGSLEHKLGPNKALAGKLRGLLQKNVGAGTIDLVWGPDIELVESKTSVHQFLGEAKYTPTLNNIFGGLGIPSTLTGFNQSSGTTNNFISLKTLIQRLIYARDVLNTFWEKEIARVQLAMNFDSPAEIEFDYPDLGDSQAEKALLIQMADRNLISDELLRERFGHNSSIEEARINNEHQERKDGDIPPKFGPFVEAQQDFALKKISLQKGFLTPEQVGIKPVTGSSKVTPDSDVGDDSKKGGIPQEGRPRNSKDKEKRKEKEFRPKTKASLELWAKATQDRIGQVIHKPVLDILGKKNVRSLTSAEHDLLEEIKFGTLFSISPFAKLQDKDIMRAFLAYSKDNINAIAPFNEVYNKEVFNIQSDLGRQLTVDELRDIQAMIYSDVYAKE